MQRSTVPNAFDYTALSTFLRCRKRYYWRHVRGIVGKAPQLAPEFGRCIHKALNIWFTTHDEKQSIEAFTGSFVEDATDEKRTIAVGVKLLNLYMEKYEHEGFKVIAAELPFSAPVKAYTAEFNLIGRIDKIIEWDGAILVMDHKTTSRLGYEFFYKIKPNMQFDGYIWAARQLGYPTCSGILLDALLVAKGLVVPAQLAKLQPLGRDVSMRTDKELDRYIRNISLIVLDIRECYEIDTWYENTESCCDFIECPYRRICKENESLHERIVEMDYKVEVWNPLKEEDVKSIA
jgi:hypothetical protein